MALNLVLLVYVVTCLDVAHLAIDKQTLLDTHHLLQRAVNPPVRNMRYACAWCQENCRHQQDIITDCLQSLIILGDTVCIQENARHQQDIITDYLQSLIVVILLGVHCMYNYLYKGAWGLM